MAQYLITCEHGGSYIPTEYMEHNQSYGNIDSRETDALDLAYRIAHHHQVPLFFTPVAREVVDPHKSLKHTQSLQKKQRNSKVDEQLFEQYYFPYREDMYAWIEKQHKSGDQVIHISIHSFLPASEEKISLSYIYDSSRILEKQFCSMWKEKIISFDTEKKYHFRSNFPRKGCASSLISDLRHDFSEELYLGIELEIGQHLNLLQKNWDSFCKMVGESLPALPQKEKMA